MCMWILPQLSKMPIIPINKTELRDECAAQKHTLVRHGEAWGLTPKHFKDKEIATKNNEADAVTTKRFKTEVRSRYRCKTSIFTAGLLQVTWGRAVSQDRWPWGFHNELLPSHTLPPVRQVSQLLRVESSWGPRDHGGGGHPGVVVHTFNLRAQAQRLGESLNLRPAWSTLWVPSQSKKKKNV